MSFQTLLRYAAVFFLLALIPGFAAGRASAQSVCAGALLGDGGVEEVCVNVTETGVGGASMDFRGPSPLAIGPVAVGAYTIDLVATYASDGGGMAMILDGTVTRTSPGTEGIVVVADGGLGTTLAFPSSGSLTLIGVASDTSQTILGGAAGFPLGQDISLTSIGNTTCDEVTFAAGAFECLKADFPVATGAVAARNITTFQLNNVGQMIDIPSGAVVGDPPLIGQDTDVIEIEIDGEIEHFSIDLFLVFGPEANCDADHLHTLVGTATSLEGGVFTDNMFCGAGKVSEVPRKEFDRVERDAEMPVDQNIGDGQGMVVAAMLTVPGILTITNMDGGTLAVTQGGTLQVDGTVVNEAGGSFFNSGDVVNTSNTIRNRGTFVNDGTIDNTGSIINECGGVFVNNGILNGNAVVEAGCPDKAQQACANALNKGLAKVVKERNKQLGRCFAGFIDRGASADACVAAPDAKVDKARGKTVAAQSKKCTGTPMGFGPSDATAVNDAAVTAGPEVVADLLGLVLDAAVILPSTDKAGAKCQKSVVKATDKCLATQLKEFNRCKKTGLKKGTILGAPDLDACLGADPKGKIAKACSATTGKLVAKVIPKTCVGKGVNLAAAFPGCVPADASALASCVDASARCHVCTALVQGDGLGVNCDAFDDAQVNASCP